MRTALIPAGAGEEMMDEAVPLLERHGLKRYEISNFARPGKECRHNLAYWNYLPYLGLGPSAVGFDGTKRFTNFRDLKSYKEKIETGNKPVHKIEILTEKSEKTNSS